MTSPSLKGRSPQNRTRRRIQEVRKQSKVLITIGACATAGGFKRCAILPISKNISKSSMPALNIFKPWPHRPPISHHVKVDYELQGCPINKYQLLEVVTSFISGKKPAISSSSVCTECKKNGNICVTVAYGIPCLGPVTHAGCGALCPAYRRGCYGCYGPKETANPMALTRWWEKELNTEPDSIKRLLQYFQLCSTGFSKGERTV